MKKAHTNVSQLVFMHILRKWQTWIVVKQKLKFIKINKNNKVHSKVDKNLASSLILIPNMAFTLFIKASLSLVLQLFSVITLFQHVWSFLWPSRVLGPIQSKAWNKLPVTKKKNGHLWGGLCRVQRSKPQVGQKEQFLSTVTQQAVPAVPLEAHLHQEEWKSTPPEKKQVRLRTLWA